MAVRYDSQVIYQFADSLERRARAVVVNATVVGALLGGGVGLAVGSMCAGSAGPAGPTQGGPYMIGLMIGAFILGLFGYSVGLTLAFQIRLRLHTMLCQVQIEENTRALAFGNPSSGQPQWAGGGRP